MDLSRFEQMDANMLYSIINMKLRNDYADLAGLCRSQQIEQARLEQKMKLYGYFYSDAVHQFRAQPD